MHAMYLKAYERIKGKNGTCMDPNAHCHFIPQSEFVEEYVNAHYIQQTLHYLHNTTLPCTQIVSILKPPNAHDKYLCNFPLRFESYANDFAAFVQRCLHDATYAPERVNPKFSDLSLGNLLSADTRRLIHLLYKKDFVRFQYRMYIPIVK